MTEITSLVPKPQSNWLKVEETVKNMSRKTVTLRVGAETVVKTGTVLGKYISGSATAAADAGNTGDGTMGAITVAADALPGVYTLTIVDTATDAGDFTVEKPDGVTDGAGTVAVAYSGDVSFTLADGATDFAVGDKFYITVVATSTYYKPAVETATDGSKVFAGVFMFDKGGDDFYTYAADTDYTVVIFEQDGMVAKEGLLLDASYDTDAKKQLIYDAMEAKGIRVATNKNLGYPEI